MQPPRFETYSVAAEWIDGHVSYTAVHYFKT